MDTSCDNHKTEDLKPTLDDLLGEFSDQELQQFGLAFASRFLMCRLFEDHGGDANPEPVEAKLRTLFPMEEGDFALSYDASISQEMARAFLWASTELPKVQAARSSEAFQMKLPELTLGVSA